MFQLANPRIELEKAQKKIEKGGIQKMNSLEEEFDNLNIQNVVVRPTTPVFDVSNPERSYGRDSVQPMNNSKEKEANYKRINAFHRAAVLFQRVLRGRAIQVIINSYFEENITWLPYVFVLPD